MRVRTIAAATAAAATAFVPGLTGMAAASTDSTGTTATPTASEAAGGRYIVTLAPRTSVTPRAAATTAAGMGARIGFVYTHALRGFSATLPPAAVTALRANPAIASIVADTPVRASTTQTGMPYGLDRIDQRSLPLSGSFTYTATGSGVTAYIVDTGIRLSHSDFGGRAVTGYDAVTPGGSASDCNGHGTHVAGTVGGASYGVAKAVRLVAVRVLDCAGSGATSGVIAGVDWVTGNHQPGAPAVANMSLGGGANSALDTAVGNAIRDGVTFAVAAGNGDFLGRQANACNYSPARVSTAITVSATDSTDRKASFANYGTCVDIFAPGVGVKSAWYTGDTAANTISGTSMAAPHAAGVVAQYLQGNSAASPATVASALSSNATTGVVTSAGKGSPNRLLFTSY